jgi:hypothetical protein
MENPYERCVYMECRWRITARPRISSAQAKALYAKDPAAAVEYVTSYGVETGQAMLGEWRNFWMHLFSLTRDFMVVTPPKTPSCIPGAPLGKGAAKGANTTCTSRPLPEAAG